MSWFLRLPLFEGVFPEKIFGLHCFPPSANLLSCPNSLFSISFIGKALHGSCMTKSSLFLCAWATSSCIFKLRTARFEPLLNLVFEPQGREKHPEQSWQSYLEFVLGAIAIWLASKLKIEGKLLSWKKSSDLLLHFTLF